jgi:hypothetical protein
MDKDGAYRVVYGTQLKDITGKVKMVAVGYGFAVFVSPLACAGA